MSKDTWNPNSDTQYEELASFTRSTATSLGVRDWEDCLQDALGYVLYGRKVAGQWASRNGSQRRHTIRYVRRIITDRIMDEANTAWNRRAFPSSEIENFPEGTSATQSADTFTAA